MLLNPEKVEKWSSMIARLFSNLSSRAERRSVSGDIQADINSFAKAIGESIDSSILPYGIKINWENAADVSYESFVKNNLVVVRLRHHSNQARNFMLATLAYVQRGLLPDTRHHLAEDVSEALDLAMVEKVLLERKRLDSLPFLTKEIIGTRDPTSSVVRMHRILRNLDAKGMFNHILLREFADLGKRMSGAVPTDDIRSETRDFVNFCEKLTEKEPGVDVSPTFSGRNLRMSIVLIARVEKYLKQGIEPQLRWIEKCLANRIDSIYLCAWGVNVGPAQDLDKSLKTHRSLRRGGEGRFKALDNNGRYVDTICIFYKRIEP